MDPYVQTDGLPDDPETGPWRTDESWVSPYNWRPENRMPESVTNLELYDTTLRDGEQAAGVCFSPEQKVEIAAALDDAGVTFIEAGFPIVSSADTEAVRAIAQAGHRAKITCLSRARREDLDLAADCGVWGTSIEVPIGYPRLKYQFNWDTKTVVDKATDAIGYAAEVGLSPSLFLIDAARGEEDTLEAVIRGCYDTGAMKRMVMVDTLGVAVPGTMAYLVGLAAKWAPGVAIEMHTHNDFGLAVANALAGVSAGAQCVQATVNGLGQRSGNASIEEVALAAKLLYGVPTQLDFTKVKALSDLVVERAGYKIADNKPVTGDKIFSWEAGLPIGALRKNFMSVEPFHPDAVGMRHELALGKQSGRASIEWALEDLGVDGLSDEQIDDLLAQVKRHGVEQATSMPLETFAGLVEAMQA